MISEFLAPIAFITPISWVLWSTAVYIVFMIPIPPTNKDLIVFKNGKRNTKTKRLDKSDELADMGFKDYNYLPKTKENEPKQFMKIMYDNTPKEHHKRINAGLRAIFTNRMD